MRIHARPALPGHEQQILAAAPDTDSAMAMVIQCMRDLEGDRQIGFGVQGSTPYNALRAWASDEGLDRDLFMLLKAVIQKLDADRMERAAAARALMNGGQ